MCSRPRTIGRTLLTFMRRDSRDATAGLTVRRNPSRNVANLSQHTNSRSDLFAEIFAVSQQFQADLAAMCPTDLDLTSSTKVGQWKINAPAAMSTWSPWLPIPAWSQRPISCWLLWTASHGSPCGNARWVLHHTGWPSLAHEILPAVSGAVATHVVTLVTAPAGTRVDQGAVGFPLASA